MSDRSMEEHLGELGSASGPMVDPTFVDRLDADLRVMHVEQASRPRSRVRRVPAIATAAVLALAVAGAVLLSRSESSEVVMTVASDTDVYFPTDGAIPGSVGLRLPDGTRIVVGADGHAVVDGVVLAPGTEAVVVGDRIDVLVVAVDDRTDSQRPPTTDRPGDDRVVVVPPSSEPPPITRSTTSAAPAASDRPAGSGPADAAPATSASTIGDRPTSQTPVTTPTTSATSRPSTRPGSTPSPTSTSRPSTTTTARPSNSIILTATMVNDLRLRLDWVVDRDTSPVGWRIRANRGDRVETVAAIRDGRARSLTVERAAVAGSTVWVEAVDGSGHAVAASNRLVIR